MVLVKMREARKNQGLSFQELADRIGVSKVYLWYIENGQRRLSYELACKIASVLDATPDQLFLPNELTVGE